LLLRALPLDDLEAQGAIRQRALAGPPMELGEDGDLRAEHVALIGLCR